MPPRNLHRSFALASAFAFGATTMLAGPTPVSASPIGDGDVLSASNGSNTIRFDNGSTVTASETIKDASWAPDGSRAIYVSGANQVKTIRYGTGGNVVQVVAATQGVQYASPSYWGDGGGLIMAVKPAATAPWRLAFMPSSTRYLPFPDSPVDGRHYLNPDAGAGGRFVYQVQPNNGGQLTGQPEVGMYDPLGGFRDIIENAANPAISPDGSRVAFVRSDGSYKQIYVSDVAGGNLVQVTSNAAQHDNPVWSPEGTELAFTQGSGVATGLPDGSTATEPHVVPNLSGVPAYQPRRKNFVLRLSGANRVGTAASVSQSYWATVGDEANGESAQSVVLSRSDMFADALGGGPLAAAKQGPLLMTSPLALDPITQAEIQRILPPGRTVYLLGGTGALSVTVENQVKALGYTVRRLWGASRYDTAVAIANAVSTAPLAVFAATGADFPDALAAGAAAGSYNYPGSTEMAVLVLTNGTTLPAATRNYLNSKYASAEFHAIGGQAVTALGPYDRYVAYGKNRYETAERTAYWYFGGNRHAGIATGTNWPDALAGGALMGTLNGPLLLTAGNTPTLSAPTQQYLNENSGSFDGGIIFGGTGVVIPALEDAIGGQISGPGGFLVMDSVAGAASNGVSAWDLAKRTADQQGRSSAPVESEAARQQVKRLAGS